MGFSSYKVLCIPQLWLVQKSVCFNSLNCTLYPSILVLSFYKHSVIRINIDICFSLQYCTILRLTGTKPNKKMLWQMKTKRITKIIQMKPQKSNMKRQHGVLEFICNDVSCHDIFCLEKFKRRGLPTKWAR